MHRVSNDPTPDATDPTSDPAATTLDFKEAFARHAAGVAVVATRDAEGTVGVTISSLASVSADPLTCVFSLAAHRSSAGRVLAADRFAISSLAADQQGVARAFAVSGAPRFTADQGWTKFASGMPRLTGAAFALDCSPLERVPVGDSVLVVALVHDVLLGEETAPLIYHARRFHRGVS